MVFGLVVLNRTEGKFLFREHSFFRAMDPHSFFADPDPAIFLNADTDPAAF